MFSDPYKALQQCRAQNKSDEAVHPIYVDRFQDSLEQDILAIYKSPTLNLRAEPRACFESEPGVGIGPVREFFCLALQLVATGLENAYQGRVVTRRCAHWHRNACWWKIKNTSFAIQTQRVKTIVKTS